MVWNIRVLFGWFTHFAFLMSALNTFIVEAQTNVHKHRGIPQITTKDQQRSEKQPTTLQQTNNNQQSKQIQLRKAF